MKSIASTPTIEAAVRDVLSEQGRLGARALHLPHDAALADAGLSSLACVDVMLALEARYGEFPEHMLSARVFQSIRTITAGLAELQAA